MRQCGMPALHVSWAVDLRVGRLVQIPRKNGPPLNPVGRYALGPTEHCDVSPANCSIRERPCNNDDVGLGILRGKMLALSNRNDITIGHKMYSQH